MKYKTQQKLERLHVFKRLLAIEKRLDKLDDKWSEYPKSDGFLRSILSWDCLGADSQTSAEDILTRIREIYDFLGVERKTTASATKLHKKKVRAK